MNPESAFEAILKKLEQAGIDYMITGSFAGNLYGVPRTTYDADVVIEAHPVSFAFFPQLIGDDFYVSPEAIEEALKYERIFNIIHMETGFKIDFIVRKNRAYSKGEFARRRLETFRGNMYWFASPEDIILSKLEWSKVGESERQFRDSLGVAQIQGDSLDKEYLEFWSERLGLQQQLARLFEELE